MPPSTTSTDRPPLPLSWFYLWACLICPSIGGALTDAVRHEPLAISLLLFGCIPAALALASGYVMRVRWRHAIAGAILAGVIGPAAFALLLLVYGSTS
jgi:hypothetical protein